MICLFVSLSLFYELQFYIRKNKNYNRYIRNFAKDAQIEKRDKETKRQRDKSYYIEYMKHI